MRIIARLHNIPFAFRTPRVAEQHGNAIGSFLELVPPRNEDYVAYIRVKLKLNVLTTIKRGIFLQVGGGEKQWVSITYEWLPSFCFLCGMVGHIEKKFPLRFEEGFVDPGQNFPY